MGRRATVGERPTAMPETGGAIPGIPVLAGLNLVEFFDRLESLRRGPWFGGASRRVLASARGWRGAPAGRASGRVRVPPQEDRNLGRHGVGVDHKVDEFLLDERIGHLGDLDLTGERVQLEPLLAAS